MRIALLTPTYGADLARFTLLRASLEASDCDYEHLAVVQTEDLAAFKQHGFSEKVRLLASADVLPPEVEATRRMVGARHTRVRKLRRSANKRFGWFADACYDGWHVQQIVKLLVPAWAEFDAVVTLDSDVIVSGQIRPNDIYQDTAVALHCVAGDTANQPHWYLAAQRVLGLPLTLAGVNTYVAHPFVFAPAAVRALHTHLETVHQRPWWEALLAQKAGDLSEFTLYGTFVREILHMRGFFEVPANGRTRWVYTGAHRKQAPATIQDTFLDPAVDYLVLQASRHWPIELYEPLLRAQLSARAVK